MIRILLKRGFKYFCLLPGILFNDLFLKNRNYIRILGYHAVGDDPLSRSEIFVSKGDFTRQIDYLSKRFSVISLDGMYSKLKESRLDQKYIALTFDDGFKNHYTNVLKVLRSYQLPAAFFICPNQIGRPDRLSMEEIREMLDSGLCTFHSHTLNHRELPFLTHEEIENEVDRSFFEKLSPSTHHHFAYPRGLYDAEVKDSVSKKYQTAVTTNPGVNDETCDFHALKRTEILRSDTFFLFQRKIHGDLDILAFKKWKYRLAAILGRYGRENQSSGC